MMEIFNPDPEKAKEVGVVTTSRKRRDLEKPAMLAAERLRLPMVRRDDNSFEKMREALGAPAFYVETDDQPFIQTEMGPVFFHEGTSVVRTCRKGASETLRNALGLRAGDKMLDATIGLGTDSLVAGALEENLSITGLEINPMLADIVTRGLKNYPFTREHLREAAGRINVINVDYNKYLKQCAAGQFDVVYFDPLFEWTVTRSQSMQKLREIAGKDILTLEAAAEARRVAARRVVVKARRGCFGEIRFDAVIPSGKSLIYGVIET